ncbi:MAG: ABC transporter ATP-binding protein [Mycobacteriales bacterium]|nr:ABC transporter ATP-binding protein [Mycobacteriales bacterium]
MTTALGVTVTTAARTIDLVKVYGSGDTEVRALDGVTLEFASGEFTAIMGPSGSGKSTLMHVMAGLDGATSGQSWVGDVDLSELSPPPVRGWRTWLRRRRQDKRADKALTALRRDRVGFVFQQFNLLPTLTAGENITLPLDIAGRDVDPSWFEEVVRAVGLGDRLGHRPAELSGGQQQRVACARALVSRPAVVFADEPTGNLDSRAGAEVLGFLRSSVKDLGQTVVMVTHDPVAASYADRVVFLADGRLVGELREPTAERVLDTLKTLEQA